LHQQDIKAWTGPEENDVSSKTFALNGIRQNAWSSMYGSSPQVHKHFHDSHDWMLPNPPPKKNEQKAHGKGCSRSSFNNPKHKKSTSPQQGENSYACHPPLPKVKKKHIFKAQPSSQL